MAIAVETRIRKASQAEHDALSARVGAAMEANGVPPDGLMVHLTRPDGDGFVILDVWRTEAEMREFYDAVIVPALAETGAEADPPSVSPVWDFARP
jgi:hypothetical protein